MRKRISFYVSGDNIEDALYQDLFKDERIALKRRLFWGPKFLYEKARSVSRIKELKIKHKVFLFLYSFVFCKLFFDRSSIAVLTNVSVQGVSPLYFNSFFSKRKKRKAYIIFIDKVGKPMSIPAKRIIDGNQFVEAFSFDEKDAFTYGFTPTINIYSKHDLKTKTASTDLFFIGYAIDKLKLLRLVAEGAQNKNRLRIMVLGVKKDDQCSDDGIAYMTRYLEYTDVLNYVSETNCILEIVQSGQVGPTMRYFEAVCYNKKLLTNNENIVNFPFYNPLYMKVFRSVADIDFDWVSKYEPICYNYSNEFSPKGLIDCILDLNK